VSGASLFSRSSSKKRGAYEKLIVDATGFSTGYWFLDDPDDSANKKWSPPDGLLEFMRKARIDGKKIVYIGFGSIGSSFLLLFFPPFLLPQPR